MTEAKLIEAMARGIRSSAAGSMIPSSFAVTMVEAALSAAAEAGYAIVPMEPTEAMWEAAKPRRWFLEKWQAMLAASEHERRPAGEE